MLSNESKRFIENWRSKTAATTGDDLNHIYTRFGDLYKIYGRLFNEATNDLINKGIIANSGGDQKSATENVIRYLTAEFIADAFVSSNNDPDIEAVIFALPHFSIKFNPQNQHEPAVDAHLLQSLKSTNNGVKILAILQIIYFVRCNFEHSRKDFQEYQRLLVEPLNKILETLIDLLYIELSK